MLNYNAYKEKRKRYKKAKHEFEKEIGAWEKEMCRLVKFFKENNFLPILDKDGQYRFKRYEPFFPDRCMYYNSVMITKSNISMIGWDCDDDKGGFVKIRLEDLLREDREQYFLALYNHFSEEEKRKMEEEKENKERMMYEELRRKYGDG